MKKNQTLKIKNLRASVKGEEILKGVSMTISPRELHIVMGPNGSGKSTMAQVLMGHPDYEVSNQKSEISINGDSMLEMSPDERAKKGLFLAFQYPTSISGVSVQKFLWKAYKSLHPTTKKGILEFRKEMKQLADKLGIDNSLLKRSLNEGFSGGEKKRIEILQLLILKPKYAILDEVDSGLDVDAIKTVAKGIDLAINKQGMGILLITHYQRILKHLSADMVHIMLDGKIVESGDEKLVNKIEKTGYVSYE